MADLKIPTRPSAYDKTAIDKNDADCLTYSVLMGGKNEDVFKLFHPEYLDAAGKLNNAGKSASKQFFIYAKNREYVDAYKETLRKYLGNGKSKDADTENPVDDSRKDKALSKLISDCLDAIEDNASLDPEVLKDFVAMAKALGVLKEEKDKTEAPRRYLAETCRFCAYRHCVESNIQKGEVINECDYCRTRKFAEKNGWQFDLTKNLDLPVCNNG